MRIQLHLSEPSPVRSLDFVLYAPLRTGRTTLRKGIGESKTIITITQQIVRVVYGLHHISFTLIDAATIDYGVSGN